MPGVALKGARLSSQQERLWSFLQGSNVYRSQCTVAMNGKLDFQTFRLALEQLVEQHTIFQTVFYTLPGMDIPIQVLGHDVHLDFPLIDLAAIAVSDQGALLETLLQSFQEEIFDLEHGPLLCPVLFRLSSETALFLVSLSPLYADAATLPLLVTELTKSYTAHLLAQNLPDEPLQYTAFSAWQDQQMTAESEEAKLAHDFWGKIDLHQAMQMLRNLEKCGIVKSDNLQTRGDADFAPRTFPLPVDDALAVRISALASHYTVSVPTIVLTCWQILLHRITGESQPVIGIACDGRNYDELAEAPGLYTRFVPFSTYLEDSWSFERALSFIKSLLQVTNNYQTYFSWPMALPGAQGFADSGFFPVLFEQESWPDSFTTINLNLQFERRSCCTEPFVLKLGTLQVGKHLLLQLHYDACKVSKERVNYLASMLQTLLHSVVEQPQAQIGAYPLLSNAQRTHLLAAFSGAQCPWPAQGLHQLFEAQVQRYPTHLAVVSGQKQLTYQQLNAQANQLAWVLRRRGIGPDVVVGLCLPRQAHMLVGILGILKAGGAYLPLDVESPAERLRYQLQESQAALLLTQEDLSARLPPWKGPTLCWEELAQELAQASPHDLPASSTGEDLAYVIYTSGSTGLPKGVMIQQSSVVNYTLALCKQLEVEPGWQYATVSTLAADLGNTAIFCALASGGCVQVLDYETVTSAVALANWAAQHPIDVLKIVPSHLSALLESERGHELLPRRALVLGGEALSAQLVERVRQKGGVCQVYNHYGPTETTIGVLVNPLGKPDVGNHEEKSVDAPVALGHPISNVQVYVLDRHLQLLPEGVIGELYIGGAGVARGYLRQARQTAERFVPHPYAMQGGERLYWTGDLARYGPGGQIEFVGRQDGQINLRGYRIEIGEIEAVLRRHPQVRDCAVVLREDTPGRPHLVGYIVPKKLPLPADMNIRDFMQEHLPDYMLPALFVYLKFLPLTANGKVDRHQLRADTKEGRSNLARLVDVRNTAVRKIVQPRDALEMQLLQLWEAILQIQPVSIFDSFFDIGGHSLLAVQLMSQIAERFGRNLDLTMLFQHPTIAALAVVLRQQHVSEQEPLLAAIQTQGSRPPFFCVHPAGGTAFRYVNLARRLGPDQPFYGIHAPFGVSVEGQEQTIGETIEEIAAHYIAAIQTVQPQGPYLLGGWSLGGPIAFEMAQQLHRQGHEVKVLAIIDSTISDSQRRERAIDEVIDLSDAGIVEDFIRAAGIDVPDDFEQLALDERLLYVVEQAKEKHFIPEDANVHLVRIFTRIRILTKHIVHIYAGNDYEGKIDYFLSGSPTEYIETPGEAEDRAENAVEPMRIQRWRTLAKGGLVIHHVPGTHVEIMDEPNVQVLAKALRLCIDEACDQLV
jgi:amino acid adenylation domain-containing protein